MIGGPLQSNKVNTALDLFDAIHTLDRPRWRKSWRGRRRRAAPARSFRSGQYRRRAAEGRRVLPDEADGFIAYAGRWTSAAVRPDVHPARGSGRPSGWSCGIFAPGAGIAGRNGLFCRACRWG